MILARFTHPPLPTQKYQRAAYETKRRKHRPVASSSSRHARAATRKPCFHPTFNDLSRGRSPCPRRAARTPNPRMARTEFPRRELRARPQIGYCRLEAPSGSRRLDCRAPLAHQAPPHPPPPPPLVNVGLFPFGPTLTFERNEMAKKADVGPTKVRSSRKVSRPKRGLGDV